MSLQCDTIVIVTEKITPEDIRHQASLWELSYADRLTILDSRERSRCSDAVAFEPLHGLILDHLLDCAEKGISTILGIAHRTSHIAPRCVLEAEPAIPTAGP
ncbi:unnamed protein product [Penicillium roqueforti FM164]|uniref:Genomic scaffold, ProqFM164S01 n=1 Tax=Penicillium roqueforti (strain FM164) TaxID=1365484 RepID=W6PZ18_PENRF|nr:unnamed protein product [Penicillium roqueforti FM164]